MIVSPNCMSTTTERMGIMNKNNAIFFATAVILATFATGCATGGYYGAGYTTTYTAEPAYVPAYSQTTYVETVTPVVYAEPTYIHTTIIDEAPPPPIMHGGHRHGHGQGHHMEARPTARTHRPTETRPRRDRPAARSTSAKPVPARQTGTKPQIRLTPSRQTGTKSARPTGAKPAASKGGRSRNRN